MAVIGIKDRLSLRLELDDGMVDNKQKVKSKTLNNIKVDAVDENIHGTALALAGLQSKSLLRVKRIEETTLTEE